MKRFVYADNAATTKVSDSVYKAMEPYIKDIYGNPSSVYSSGTDVKTKIEEARSVLSLCIGANPDEIYFTSGGTEADNWAIRGIMENQIKNGKNHIITTKFEHHAVLHTVEYLEKHGYSVTYLDVHKDGIIDLNEFEKAICPETGLVTIMYANNEIGTIQPINEIGCICKKYGIIFHTDAVQALGNIKIQVKEQNIDLLSLSAHKLHGPKGIGALYVRKGIQLNNLIYGGAQESGKRSGTENVSGIIGFAQAAKDATNDIDSHNEKVSKMRDRLFEGASKIDRSIINGSLKHRLPGNFNMCFEGIEGESLLLSLDYEGISASSGSACTSGSLNPSHVLLSLGLPHEVAHGSLRLTLSDYNSEEDIDYILEVLPKVVKRLRSMSPLWERISKQKNK